MTHKKYLLILLAGIAATALSCQKESPAGETDITDGQTIARQGGFTLLASTSALCKTELGQGNFILWKEGDKLSVWQKGSSTNKNVCLTLNSEDKGKAVAGFTGSLTPAAGDFTLYSVYPYAAAYGDDPTALELTIPSTVNQITDVNALVGVSDFMLGSADFNAGEDNYRIAFSHPLAILHLSVDASNSVLKSATFKSLTFSANTSAIAGKVTADASLGTIAPALEGTSNSVVISFPETAKAAQKQDAWIAIRPVDLTSEGLKITLEMTNGQKIDFPAKPQVAFKAQTIYDIAISDIDAKVDAGKASPVFFDLVAAGGGQRSNCYVIREGGYYKFAAQKVNNKANCFKGDKPNSNGYKADWIWATGEKSEVDFVSIGNSGAINFRVQDGVNGNTVIALRDPEGTIVWSWHIWVCRENPLEPNHYGRNDAWLMARFNLGAFSNEEANVDSYGLMYQWGRKDPFPGTNSIGSITAGKEATTFVTGTQKYVINPDNKNGIAFKSVRNSAAGANGSEVDYTVSHPTENLHYNGKSASGINLEGTWFYSTSAADAAKLWNGTTTKTAKTDYDPCPQGYCVPVTNAHAWYSLWNGAISWESNGTTAGVCLNDPNDKDNKAYYPACGYRSAGQLINVGFACYYWAANTISDSGKFFAYGLGNESRTKFSNGAKLQTQYALPVRCMKI